jgi:hypothetical protein
MARVPYFASILPHVVRMEPGLAAPTLVSPGLLKVIKALCPSPSC